jgi:hypothetical protein
MSNSKLVHFSLAVNSDGNVTSTLAVVYCNICGYEKHPRGKMMTVNGVTDVECVLGVTVQAMTKELTA